MVISNMSGKMGLNPGDALAALNAMDPQFEEMFTTMQAAQAALFETAVKHRQKMETQATAAGTQASSGGYEGEMSRKSWRTRL
jgi:hypothetical protein